MVWKGLANLLRKTAIASAIAVPLVFGGCEPEDEDPINKSIEQTVELNNDVEIKYSAFLSDVDKAQLDVKKEGVSILTEQINDISLSGADYRKTYSYSVNPNITKGNYEFVLSSDNLEKKNSVQIQNYKPVGNFTDLNLNLEENSEINLALPNTPDKIFDKNPEDNPVLYANAKSLDSKTSLTLNGNNLKIKANPNYTGGYQIELEYGSAEGGLEKSVLQGTIIDNMKKIIVDFLNRPKKGDSNYYGSGDADKDGNIGTLSDWSRMNQIYDGTFSDPSDTRLQDRIDVNGDGKFNEEDIKIVYDKATGVRAALPSEWGKINKAQRIDWVLKMFGIDNTSEIIWSPGFDCTKFAYQTNINFNVYNEEDISNIKTFYSNFSFSDRERFNLPLYGLQLVEYDSQGKPKRAHAINIIFVGDNIPQWDEAIKIDPQDDSQVAIGEGFYSSFGDNTKLYLRGSPFKSTTPNIIDSEIYVTYKVENKNVTLFSINPDIELVTQREK